jgi:ATP-binding protein involved in chromosome partitioning
VELGQEIAIEGRHPIGVTESDVRAALGRVEDPDLRRPITELGMVRAVLVLGDRVRVSLALVLPRSASKETLERAAVEAVRSLGVPRVEIDFTTMTDEDRTILKGLLQASSPGGGPLGSARVIAVSSGKGGVGKSSVTTNLAVAMARRGLRTAVIDADVYGFSIPRMIGIDQQPVVIDRLIIPPQAHGVSIISIGFFVQENSAVIWRGPMLHKALEQFVTDVHWGELDVALIDMPPGTGDVSLTMSQFLPATEVVVVTTPQPAAQRVAQRAAFMARKVDLHVSGVIENMSWFTGRDGYRYDIFGAGGGKLLAQELEVPLLGQIPLLPPLREGADVGRPVVAEHPESEAAQALDGIAAKLIELKPRKIRLPVLGPSKA